MLVKEVLEEIEEVLYKNDELKNDEISVDSYRKIIDTVSKFKNSVIDKMVIETNIHLNNIESELKE